MYLVKLDQIESNRIHMNATKERDKHQNGKKIYNFSNFDSILVVYFSCFQFLHNGKPFSKVSLVSDISTLSFKIGEIPVEINGQFQQENDYLKIKIFLGLHLKLRKKKLIVFATCCFFTQSCFFLPILAWKNHL